jgi:hypothetical protein
MRTVVIVGNAPRRGDPVPHGEVWTCNDFPSRVPEGYAWNGWSRHFDLHTPAHILKHRPLAWSWYRSIAKTNCRPVYLHAEHHDVPGSVAYPREKIQCAFGTRQGPEEFFTSSFDWMMALAIYEGFTRIVLRGVDLWDGAVVVQKPTERERLMVRQRNGAHYWIARARGRGIEVNVPNESSLCKTERLYGWFDLTSDRNFCSMSLDRFLEQLDAANRMRDPAYDPPGVDASMAAAS